jgi:hypothetical protein
MSKKWLCSVAVGALLIAGEAMGVTVHDVLSNGFWSAEQRADWGQLERDTLIPKYKILKDKTITDEDGEKFFSKITTSGVTLSRIHWKNKLCYNGLKTESEQTEHRVKKLIATNQVHQQKQNTIMDDYLNMKPSYEDPTRYRGDVRIDYMSKPRKKEARPIGPYVMEDWFPDKMTTKSYQSCRFFGTEHNAVTNIISDNEAYITGTISQTGHIDEFEGEKVDEPASLLRTYTQHITTDADHVYVEQEITENCQNNPACNVQQTYQTQYTATFKKGRWKGETETISQVSNSQLADWYLKRYYQNSR